MNKHEDLKWCAPTYCHGYFKELRDLKTGRVWATLIFTKSYVEGEALGWINKRFYFSDLLTFFGSKKYKTYRRNKAETEAKQWCENQF